MVGANLEGAKLRNANLKSANLCEAFLSGADLRDANLDNADLEGANLQRALLTGANLSRANLEGANLQGANLAGARLTHAQLDLANLGGAVKMMKAELTNANLNDSNLEDGDFTGATLADAQMRGIKARGVKLVGAVLSKVDFAKANLANADLSNADLRYAMFTDAKLEGANLTGAKVHGLTAKGAQLSGITADWLDNSPNADGSIRVAGAQVMALLAGEPVARPTPPEARSANHRYFGRGDVLRNASLQFDEGATVEIESLFESCSIALGRGTELLIGSDGVLTGCQITGAGNITINGKFFDAPGAKRSGPAIVGAHQVVVSSSGAMVGVVQQPPELTRFAFEPGCQLRMRITTETNGGATKDAGNGQGAKQGKQ
jgi:uncharacterized protein YjbI with pentapeptide repeats